jgi:hypothetical protein
MCFIHLLYRLLRNASIVLFILFVPLSVHAKNPTLIGKWQSDRELTMTFAKEHGKLSDNTSLFLDQLMGRLTLTFTKSTVFSYLPDTQSTTVEGIKSQLIGFNERNQYKSLATTETQIAILSLEPVTGIKTITTYNFEDENTMWVYLGGRNFSKLNIREYFRRIQ